MNLDLLRTFLAIRRAGGMRAAAASLHVTQPAISARIRELESRLGAALFERLGRRLVLTEAGRIVAAEAPALLEAAADLERRVQETERSQRGSLRLATIDAASIYVLPPIYVEYRRTHPHVQMTVQVVDSRRVLASVVEMEVDVGVLALPAAHPEVEFHTIFEDPLVCIAAPTHPLAHGRRTRLAEVASQPLVLYGEGSTTRGILDAVFSAHGVVPNVVMETASPEAMKRLAEVGVGLTVVPRALVRDDLAAGRLVQVPVRDVVFSRSLATAVRRGRRLPATARSFLELVHARYPEAGSVEPKRAGGRSLARRRSRRRS